jgi:hypothetical protein
VANDLVASAPASVTVTFPRPDGTAAAYPVTLASLGLPEFQGVTGFPGSALLHSTALANAPAGTTPPNDAELAALARQLAADWYRHRVAPHDVLYAGVAPWVPSGFTDVIEWTQTPRQVTTRARRGPWLDHREEVFHWGTAGAGAPGGGSVTVGPGQTLTVAPGATLSVQGNLVTPLPAPVTLSSASYNNYALPTSTSLVVFNPTAAGGVTITGLAPATPGQQVTIYNSGSVDLTLSNNDSSSTTSNQLSTTWAGSLVIPPCSSAQLQAGKGPSGQWGVLNPGPMSIPWQRPAPTQTLTGSVNNFNPGGYGLIPFDPAGGNYDLTGIKPPFPGATLTVQNVGTSGTLTLTHSDPASSPGNQLSLYNGADITLQPGQSLDLTVGAGGSFASTQSQNGGGGSSGTLAPGLGVPGWVKVTLLHGAFQGAAATKTVAVYTLPAQAVVEKCVVEHDIAFTGGGLTGYSLLDVGFGTPADGTFFGGSGSYNLFAAPADTEARMQPTPQTGYAAMPKSISGPSTVNATVQAFGGTGFTNQTTQGRLYLYLLISVLDQPITVPPVSQQPVVMYLNGYVH